MPWAGSRKQRDIDHVEPAQNAVDDRPENRVVVGIGDRDGERRAKAHAVFRALDPNPVVSTSVHGDPSRSVGRNSEAYCAELAADYAALIRPTSFFRIRIEF